MTDFGGDRNFISLFSLELGHYLTWQALKEATQWFLWYVLYVECVSLISLRVRACGTSVSSVVRSQLCFLSPTCDLVVRPVCSHAVFTVIAGRVWSKFLSVWWFPETPESCFLSVVLGWQAGFFIISWTLSGDVISDFTEGGWLGMLSSWCSDIDRPEQTSQLTELLSVGQFDFGLCPVGSLWTLM